MFFTPVMSQGTWKGTPDMKTLPENLVGTCVVTTPALELVLAQVSPGSKRICESGTGMQKFFPLAQKVIFWLVKQTAPPQDGSPETFTTLLNQTNDPALIVVPLNSDVIDALGVQSQLGPDDVLLLGCVSAGSELTTVEPVAATVTDMNRRSSSGSKNAGTTALDSRKVRTFRAKPGRIASSFS
jgi:hypothetical protein